MQYKYMCPFGDEYKFTSKKGFINHLAIYHLVVNINDETFELVNRSSSELKNDIYEFKKYEFKKYE